MVTKGRATAGRGGEAAFLFVVQPFRPQLALGGTNTIYSEDMLKTASLNSIS